jgi:4'-phosphopantetheinyl transferase EntD
MIGDILPPEVAVAEEFGDVADAEIFPEEEKEVANAVDKRRREFATARVCARKALAELGLPPAPIPRGVRGAPQWPPGVVGSITHCAGYRAAAVARDHEVVTIGLDAEPHDKLPAGVLDAVSSEQERARLAELSAGWPDVCWDRMLFCVKESVYKAWYPLTARWLGFEDASVDIDPVAGTFTAALLVAGPVVNGAEVTGFTGRWLVSNGLITTAIALTAASAALVFPGCSVRRFAVCPLGQRHKQLVQLIDEAGRVFYARTHREHGLVV